VIDIFYCNQGGSIVDDVEDNVGRPGQDLIFMG
jgi:hypothetical protein